MGHTLTMAVVAVFPILAVVAAVTDFFTMTIANRVSFGLLAAGIAAVLLVDPTLAGFGPHLAAAGIVFAVGFGCFSFGWMGGGDVKFATAIAFWLGWGQLLDFSLWASLWGGGLTALVIASDRLLDPLPILKIGFLGRFREHRRVPYGIALAAGGLQVFADGPWIRVFL